MKIDKFPSRYYFYLLIALFLVIVFWVWLFHKDKYHPYRNQIIDNRGNINEDNRNSNIRKFNNDYERYRQLLPDEIGKVEVIDTSEIITDPNSGRRIVGNLVNIAIKNEDKNLKTFVVDFFSKFNKNEYQIVYLDSIINRIQVKMNHEKTLGFKNKIKDKLNNYDLLVWDEVLFQNNYAFNDKGLNNKMYSWYFDAINIEKAWKSSRGKSDIVIAVIDNGFDLNHPELVGKSIKPYNVVEKNQNVTPIHVNHGTHVASTIVANANNNFGLLGIAPNCKFMPIKVSDNNGLISNSYIIDAILYAIKNNASVINLSLGIAIDPNFEIPPNKQEEYIHFYAKDEESFWDELFKYADEKKVTCVIAAGNNNMLTGFDPFQRSKYTIKVGAIDQRLKKAVFSNYGDYTNIYAPGVHIYSAKPNRSFEFLDGTSMATPIVAGSIALMKSKNKNISTKKIIEKLESSSKKIDDIKLLDVYKLLN